MLESINTYSFRTIPNNKRGAWHIYGTLEAFRVEYKDTEPTIRYVVRLNNPDDMPKDWHKAGFVIETSRGLEVFYVAGYSQDKTELYIDPLGSVFHQAPRKTYFLALV